ncbi:uncharacterized protein YjhX (UPF0386 family) [Bradyrhizobium algeriense]|uniref:Uncharacterized protein YjhX (UPF0386 family) n=1 Tax=Bradyrhizobium algeriense TaxID=634784 RepID=A0ABU8BH32_9BRAD
MLADTYTHEATVAYHIKDAIIHNGSVYASNMRYIVSDRALEHQFHTVQHFGSASLTSSAAGHTYFGHWLRDDCLKYLLAEQAGAPICIGQKFSSHQKMYASYFGQDWTPTESAFIDDLVIFQDHAQNSLKKKRYLELQDRLSRLFPDRDRDKVVFLRRGRAGSPRFIANEGELLECLAREGVEIVDVEDDLPTILSQLKNAKLVMSIEGSHISHCTYALASGCALLVLEPPDRFTATHRHWATCTGIHFGFVVGEPESKGYRFSSKEILQLSERLLGLGSDSFEPA